MKIALTSRKDCSSHPTTVSCINNDTDPKHGRKCTALAHRVDAIVRGRRLEGSVDVVSNTKENSKENGRMMPLVDMLGALLADHETKNEDDGSNSNGWDERQDGWHNADEANDQINETVHDRVASFGSNALMDGMTNVDHSTKGGTKDGTEKSSNSIADHGLADGVGVSSLLSGHKAHHISETSSDRKGKHDANIGANVSKSFVECAADPGTGGNGGSNCTLESVSPA